MHLIQTVSEYYLEHNRYSIVYNFGSTDALICISSPLILNLIILFLIDDFFFLPESNMFLPVPIITGYTKMSNAWRIMLFEAPVLWVSKE